MGLGAKSKKERLKGEGRDWWEKAKEDSLEKRNCKMLLDWGRGFDGSHEEA